MIDVPPAPAVAVAATVTGFCSVTSGRAAEGGDVSSPTNCVTYPVYLVPGTRPVRSTWTPVSRGSASGVAIPVGVASGLKARGPVVVAGTTWRGSVGPAGAPS